MPMRTKAVTIDQLAARENDFMDWLRSENTRMAEGLRSGTTTAKAQKEDRALFRRARIIDKNDQLMPFLRQNQEGEQ